ncbi:CoA ester lyase [Herminiimonas sp. CN]|uniref:HpcH/HpaI aldolase/citrate lyase family protein n=1 Tax=Herminiimonas sp. CN TaxID=1349818 RepID=UPI0004741493|nr:aldolase/citrate lyase family protein [Herminiimonas sp. CN]
MHPSEALFQGKHQPVSIPVCDHYAGSEKLMRKSVALQQQLGPVFDITLDAEDGAATGNEASHARLIASIINSADNRFDRIGARIHDCRHPFFEQDIALLCQDAARRLAYLVVPKIHDAADACHAIALINRHAQQAGRAALPVHVLIETHGALADVQAIAALPQVECLSFGIMDFVSEHHGAIPGHAMRSPGQFTHGLIARAKLEIAAACHAHGKVPSHNVTTEIRDMAIVANDAHRAATEFGYSRMWSIHPDQIKPILHAMSPLNTEIDQAALIITAARNAQWGPIQHNGVLHDRASYRYYWTILKRAKSSGMTIPEWANALLQDECTPHPTTQLHK